MTRSKKSSAGNGKPQAKGESYGVSFVEIPLTLEDKHAIEQIEAKDEDLFASLERLADNGYKVSLSIDYNNTGGIVAITGTKGCAVSENVSRCLVSRGPDVRQALICALYKLEIYCPDEVFPFAGALGGSDYS